MISRRFAVVDVPAHRVAGEHVDDQGEFVALLAWTAQLGHIQDHSCPGTPAATIGLRRGVAATVGAQPAPVPDQSGLACDPVKRAFRAVDEGVSRWSV